MADTRRTTYIQEMFSRFTERAPSKSSATAAVCQDTARGEVRVVVPPNGREVFLSPRVSGRVYEITVAGTCRYGGEVGVIFTRPQEGWADALYHTDKLGNFVVTHDWLQVDGKPVTYSPWICVSEEDRETHTYRLRIDATAEKTSVSFCMAPLGLRTVGTSGVLTLTVRLLPEGTPSPRAIWQAAQVREETAKQERKAAQEKEKLEKQAAEESRRREEKVRGEAARRVAELEALRRRVHRESNLLDPEFQEQYARHHLKSIVEKSQDAWAREYDQFMENLELKALAETKAPEVIAWFEARVTIVQLAERLMLAPPPPPAAEPAVAPMTAEETRSARLRKHADEHDDRIALMKLKGEKAAEGTAVLDSLPLDDDLKERLKTELADSILAAEGEQHGGNNDVTL